MTSRDPTCDQRSGSIGFRIVRLGLLANQGEIAPSINESISEEVGAFQEFMTDLVETPLICKLAFRVFQYHDRGEGGVSIEFHYLLANQICGPCPFEELVAHVQNGVLSVDDLVKPSSDDRWIPAATIYGLFHMAGRQYKLNEWEKKRQRDAQSVEYDSYDTVELEEIRAEIIARQKLVTTQGQQEEFTAKETADPLAEIQRRDQAAQEEQRTQERLDFALAAANELKNEKYPIRRRSLIRRFLDRLFSK